MSSKRFISILLTVIVLISALSFNSFAASSQTFTFDECDITWMRGGENDYSDTVYFYNRVVEGVPCVLICNSDPDADSQGLAKFVTATRVQNLDLDAEYKISFDSVINFGGAYQVWVYFCDSSGNAIGEFLYMQHIPDTPSPAMKLKRHECNFTLKNSGINSNQNVFLAIEFVVPKAYSQDIYVGGSAVTITNLDDNSAFFDGIWGTIKHIFYAIVGGTCDDGDYTTEGLFGKLKEGLDNLGDRIGDFFSDLKEKITNKLNEVKTGIVNAINSIKNWLNELGDSIANGLTALKNYILYFQHPVTINADGVPIGEDGKPVYENPFSKKFEDIYKTLSEWLAKLQNFVDSINLSSQNVSEYLKTFTNAFERFGKGAPVFLIVISFGFLLIVIKKVVGR